VRNGDAEGELDGPDDLYKVLLDYGVIWISK
jgi:hypothetical protein